MSETIRPSGWLGKIADHIPPGQFGRYLLVGAVNTVFGYGTYALLTSILDTLTPYGYILAAVVSALLSISVSYLNYKWFIFKTKGNYLQEWFRCIAVYSGGIVIGTVSLPLLVLAIRRLTNLVGGAPYIAGALLTAVNTVFSFLGHKNFSFRSPSLVNASADRKREAATAGHH